ncbi:helix-hairpin-helix domain-containing protein [Deferribacter abyssi]|uniref:SF1B family DNA helicase RecD2 n=1 Tax=Deferribacter abyssi TaxID=213806 RepID=UPI003C183A2C
MVCIIGQVEKVIFNNGSYYIIQLANKIVVKGHITDSFNGDITGLKYKFYGNWTTDRYGRVFQFDYAEMQSNELFFFLTKIVSGIGEKLAKHLIEVFGDELETVIEEKPHLLMEVKGIKEKKLEKILKSWKKYSHLRQLSKFLGQYGATSNLIVKVYNTFGEKAIEEIRNNPYCLTKVTGIGFKKADEIAKSMGIEVDSPFRVQACSQYILEKESNENGHTYLDYGYFLDRLKDELGLDAQVDIESLFEQAITLDPNIQVDGDRVYLGVYKKLEEKIFDFISKRANIKTNFFSDSDIGKFIKYFEHKSGIRLSDKQKEAVLTAVNSKIFALSGYAGTGKTTVSKVILLILNSLFKGEIVGCAMSGIASRRLANVTGFPAYTIHSLLRFTGNGFEYNKDNPLPYKVIILDEAGMVNVGLFYALINAISDDSIFIMVGDDAQLPPIGAGNVFSDIINTGMIPSVKLDKIYRQGNDSVINFFANTIRQGNVPNGYKERYKDWDFIPVEIEGYWEKKKKMNDEEFKKLREDINSKILQYILKLTSIYKEHGIKNLIADLQVLVPQRKGLLGIENLNIELQRILNPPEMKSEYDKLERNGKWYCVGDKVVHLKNKDMPVLDDSDISSKRIFNGTLGVIKRIDHDNENVYVETVTNDIVIYDFLEMGDIIDLAYALTVHKAQGSEFKIVIIPLSLSNYIMLDNQWFYTAITRAKIGVHIIGEPYAFVRACKNISKRYRNTWLKELFCF